eukprot:TRINITY_DN2939_c0_g2_i2.p3 TRINITY_DN2939_c0_g2~~TRINITY_DN2939_c0_g2_i2.p3  ORF type:complete len:112 (-),score=7.15 TRINITY_DN2939_c0_g2_i2:520-855(-)
MPYMLCEYSTHAYTQHESRAPCVELASKFFFNDILEHGVFKAEVGEHLLKLTILSFKVFHPLDVGRLHATVFGLPLVVSGAAHAVFSADVDDGSSAFHRLQDLDDLVLTES